MNNGPLGGPANRGLRGPIGLHDSSHRTPAIKTDADPHRSAIRQFAAHAAHRLATAMGATSTKSAIGGLLGHESFSAGVAFGMARNLAVSVYQLGDLLKMFAMAEYDDSQHSGSFWRRIERSMMFGPAGASAGITMISLAHFWPGFDRAAKDARDQRDALFQLVGYACEHPGEVLKTVSDSQAKKYQEFKACLERHSLAGDFHAGDLFGELLLGGTNHGNFRHGVNSKRQRVRDQSDGRLYHPVQVPERRRRALPVFKRGSRQQGECLRHCRR